MLWLRMYVAKRRMDCYDIYVQRANSWCFHSGFEYLPDEDICGVRYKLVVPDPTFARTKALLDSLPSSPALEKWRFDCESQTQTRDY